MKSLSERLESAMRGWPVDSDTMKMLVDCHSVAKLYEDAPVLPVVKITATGFTWSAVDVTGYADYGQRVRIVLDKEG